MCHRKDIREELIFLENVLSWKSHNFVALFSSVFLFFGFLRVFCGNYIYRKMMILPNKQFCWKTFVEKFNFNPLSANPTKWGSNCLTVFDHFWGLLLKGLIHFRLMFPFYSPWKYQKIKRFFGVFRGYKMRTLIRNGLIYSLPNPVKACIHEMIKQTSTCV